MKYVHSAGIIHRVSWAKYDSYATSHFVVKRVRVVNARRITCETTNICYKTTFGSRRKCPFRDLSLPESETPPTGLPLHNAHTFPHREGRKLSRYTEVGDRYLRGLQK